MCGIAGIVTRDPERPTSPERLAAMVATLRHRGPDDRGQVALRGAALGMRRLSIIDVAGGRQPFANSSPLTSYVVRSTFIERAATARAVKKSRTKLQDRIARY